MELSSPRLYIDRSLKILLKKILIKVDGLVLNAGYWLRGETNLGFNLVFYCPESQFYFYIDLLGTNLLTENSMTRPHTSITRPNTGATIFVDDYSSCSFCEDASCDIELSSFLSEWEDDDLASIESIVSPRNEVVSQHSDTILESLDERNIAEGNKTHSGSTPQLCHAEMTSNHDLSEASHLEIQPSELQDFNIEYSENDQEMALNTISILKEGELTITSI